MLSDLNIFEIPPPYFRVEIKDEIISSKIMGKSLRGKRLKRLGLFWMGVFLSFSLWAQTGVICGTVTDAKMKEPLIGASVVIEGTTVGAITDIDGNFRIENVRPGTYTVAASYVSYQTQTVKDVPVVARQEAVLNIELSDANLQLQNVVVVAQRKLGTEMAVLNTEIGRASCRERV